MSENNITANDESTADELIHQQEFGKILRDAREAAAYTVLEVAEELKLSEEIIRALEFSQIDALPAATFTQGYIRSYARLLKLPGDEIVAAYNQVCPQDEPALGATTGVPAQRSSRDSGVKLITYSLIGAGFVLLFFWWSQTDFEWAANWFGKKQDLENTTQNIIPQQDQMQADDIFQPEPELLTVAQPEISSEITEAVEVAPDVEVVPEAEVQDEPISKVEIKQAAPEPDNKISATAPVGDDVLVMETTSESWTEIQDVNNHRLFFQLMKKGNSYRMQGQAPFRIFMGNAPSISIQVNDMPVDITGYTRKNNIAHVSIDDAAIVKSLRESRNIKKQQPEVSDTDEAEYEAE
ncbi:MAG: DUF4115 domain-containing protein [Gammaproteobacteria bacterium]|nr:DUF4115 domain-containing protein [Gammaproteobacteria bacterium]